MNDSVAAGNRGDEALGIAKVEPDKVDPEPRRAGGASRAVVRPSDFKIRRKRKMLGHTATDEAGCALVRDNSSVPGMRPSSMAASASTPPKESSRARVTTSSPSHVRSRSNTCGPKSATTPPPAFPRSSQSLDWDSQVNAYPSSAL